MLRLDEARVSEIQRQIEPKAVLHFKEMRVAGGIG
jgi:hypothetical protein